MKGCRTQREEQQTYWLIEIRKEEHERRRRCGGVQVEVRYFDGSQIIFVFDPSRFLNHLSPVAQLRNFIFGNIPSVLRGRLMDWDGLITQSG